MIPSDAELTPRNGVLPPWDSIPEDQRRFYARQMEVYSGFQENADWNVGRLIDAIGAMGELDNTLVIYIFGDNGSSMEGTPTGSFNWVTTTNGIPLTPEMQLELIERYGGIEPWAQQIMSPHFAAAWAWAGNTPFHWGKQVSSHLGGTRNPMVIHWPARIADGGALRTHLTHAIDVGPTILQIAVIPQPSEVDCVEQQPMHGVTFEDSLSDANAPERHTQQYFETMAYRAMYRDGWWLATMAPRIPWDVRPEAIKRPAPGVWDPDSFWEEAERYRVTPLLTGLSVFFGMLPPLGMQTKHTFYGDVQNVASGMIPRIYNRSYSISADLVIPPDGAEGVIVAEAGHLGGFSLFVEDGRLKHTYSMMGVFIYKQASEEPLPTGDVTVMLVFEADEARPGTGGEKRVVVNVSGAPVIDMEREAAGDADTRAGASSLQPSATSVIEDRGENRRSPPEQSISSAIGGREVHGGR